MKPILNIEDIVKLKMDEKLIECIAGKVNYYRFLCFHPRNSNFVILLNHCEEPVRFHYKNLIDRFFTDYTQRDIITYRKDYALKEIKEFEQALSELEVIKPKKFLGFFRQLTGITIEGAFNGCSACVEIMTDDDNGVSMMHYIDYEDIIGVELIKN